MGTAAEFTDAGYRWAAKSENWDEVRQLLLASGRIEDAPRSNLKITEEAWPKLWPALVGLMPVEDLGGGEVPGFMATLMPIVRFVDGVDERYQEENDGRATIGDRNRPPG